MKTTIILSLLVLVAADAAPQIHNTRATDAMATYKAQSEQARRTYLDSLIAADKREIASLDLAIKQAEASGDDPDDIAAVNAVKKDAAARLAKHQAALARNTNCIIWDVGWGGGENRYWLYTSGVVTDRRSRVGRWQQTGQQLIIVFSDEKDTFMIDKNESEMGGHNQDGVELHATVNETADEQPPASP